MIKLGIYEKALPSTLTLKGKLNYAKTFNYDFVELSIDESDEKLERLNMQERNIRQLKDDMDYEGISFETLCLSGQRRFPLGSNDPAIRKESLKILQKAVLLADALDIRLIQIPGYDVYYEDSSEYTRQYFAEGLAYCTEIASCKNITLTLETMETKFIDTVKKAKDWVDKVNSFHLKIYPDTGNLTNASFLYGTDVCEDLMSGISDINAVHLKESKPGIYRDLLPGEGHVDFKRIVRTCVENGIKRFTAELWFNGKADWDSVLLRTNSYFRQYLNNESGGKENVI